MNTSLRLLSFLLCVILFGLSSNSWANSSPDTIKEPESGTRFPTALNGKSLMRGFQHPTGKVLREFNEQVLTGVGIREKTIFGVDVYAMGIYVDAQAASKALVKWSGKSHKQLRGDKEFYKAMLKGGFPTTLRLVMCRDVDGADMASAFDDSLGPRMKALIKAGNKKETEGHVMGTLEDLKRFRKYFDGDEVKNGVELLFTWDRDGVLYTRVGSKLKGGIHSQALSRALFDVYLGEKPISASAKKNLVKRVPDLLTMATCTK